MVRPRPRLSGKGKLLELLRNLAPDFLQYICERLEVSFHNETAKPNKIAK